MHGTHSAAAGSATNFSAPLFGHKGTICWTDAWSRPDTFKTTFHLFFLSVLVVLGIVSPLLLPISGILGVALDDATLAHNSVPSSALVFANDT